MLVLEASVFVQCSSQIKNTFFKFCDSLVGKCGKMKSLVRELDEKFSAQDVKEKLDVEVRSPVYMLCATCS